MAQVYDPAPSAPRPGADLSTAPGPKVFLLLFLQKKKTRRGAAKRILLFLKKKKQKNFISGAFDRGKFFPSWLVALDGGKFSV
jgi:hypothetical protein